MTAPQHLFVKPKNEQQGFLKRFLKGLMTKPSGAEPRHFSLLGVSMANATMAEALQDMTTTIVNGKRRMFAFVNADCLNRARGNPAYARVLSRQHLTFADGSGIRLAGLMRGINVRGNVNGTDMFPLLCEQAAAAGHGIYLLGARQGLAEEVAKTMLKRFPKLVISGTQHGYFKQEDTAAVIEKINYSGCKILLVAMGAPQQELWINRNAALINANVIVGVGGLFDFYSGRISRAPLWMRESGLEWIWRLRQEPGRMWRRYVIGNPLFLWRCWHEHKFLQKQIPFAWHSTAAHSRSALRRMGWWMQRARYGGTKRCFDIVGSGLGLLALSPLLALIALAIKLESPGPVFFSQQRVGFEGKRFRMWKFRSMFIDAEARRAALLSASDRSGAHFKMKHDPRITKMGRVIRRASIDELPQLFNVFLGSMSIVGPRPNMESEVSRYRMDEFGRLDSKPGITCIWQVSGRAEVPWEQQVQMDLDYVYAPSIGSDFRLIAKTLPAILSGRGAY
jgi:exopolysaccharide biosynthesis WecB/TagA/CpsF family protein